MRGNVKENNNPVNTRFVDKTSNIRNLSEKITSDVIKHFGDWVVLAIFAKKQQFSVALPTP